MTHSIEDSLKTSRTAHRSLLAVSAAVLVFAQSASTIDYEAALEDVVRFDSIPREVVPAVFRSAVAETELHRSIDQRLRKVHEVLQGYGSDEFADGASRGVGRPAL